MWILAIFIRGVDSVRFFFYNVYNIINRIRLDFGEQTCQINVEYMPDKGVLDVAVVFSSPGFVFTHTQTQTFIRLIL